jgi:hypothetical protein
MKYYPAFIALSLRALTLRALFFSKKLGIPRVNIYCFLFHLFLSFIDLIHDFQTNGPDAVDQALRRPGRFDREIALGVPDEAAHAEIFSMLTQR